MVPTSLQPFLKAVAPAVLTLVAVLVEWLINGTWSRTNTATAITGLVAATITYFVPNIPATTAPPDTALVAVDFRAENVQPTDTEPVK